MLITHHVHREKSKISIVFKIKICLTGLFSILGPCNKDHFTSIDKHIKMYVFLDLYINKQTKYTQYHCS